MTRPTMPAAVLTATAIILLSACGGGGDKSSSSDPIKGAQTSSPSPASPSAAASASVDANRPALTTSKDFTTVFQGWTSTNATKAAILEDGKAQVLAVNSAIFKLNPSAPEVTFYNTGGALSTAKDWIDGFKVHRLTMTGTVRYYRPFITVPDKNTATLSYCSDESKGFSRSLKTGKVDVTPVDANSYVLYSTVLEKNKQGIWQTTGFNSERGRCKA